MKYFYRLYYEPDRIYPQGKQEIGFTEYETPQAAFEIGDKMADGRRGWFCDVIDENKKRILDEYGIAIKQEVEADANEG